MFVFSTLKMLNSSSSVYLTFAKKIWNLTFFNYSFVLRKIKHLVTKIKVRNKCISIALRWRFFLFVCLFFLFLDGRKNFYLTSLTVKNQKCFVKKLTETKVFDNLKIDTFFRFYSYCCCGCCCCRSTSFPWPSSC